MEIYRNIFGMEVKFTYKSIALLSFLAVFPNILGLIVLQTPFGFNIHFFQYLIFAAALLYGPFGGAVSGAFGSVYTALLLNNPYIIFGNIILGFFFGYFAKNRKLHVMPAMFIAYALQLPWLYVTDIYFAKMPIPAVQGVIIALLASNIIWAYAAGKTYKKIGKLIE